MSDTTDSIDTTEAVEADQWATAATEPETDTTNPDTTDDGHQGDDSEDSEDTAEQADTTDTDTDTAQDNANKEAAKYRRKLRATETERDQLAQRLELLQRAEVERIAATVLTDPADIWVAGTELGQLHDANGNLDPDKIKTAL